MRRWTVRILLCLIFGAITTVAVAWGFSASAHFDQSTEVNRTVWCAAVARWSDIDNSATEMLNVLHEHRATGLHRVFLAAEYGFAVDSDALHPSLSEIHAPGWSKLVERLPLPNVEVISELHECLWIIIIEEAAGWPRLALTWSIDNRTGSFFEVTHPTGIHGFPFEVRVNGPKSQMAVRALPLRPILPGFLIDTLFYAAIWGGVFFGFAGAKRAIRRQRGRCPRCGYDLRDDLAKGCSECGWGR